MGKSKRPIPFLAVCLVLCGAALIFYPMVEQYRADEVDAGMYKEIAAVARGPDSASAEVTSQAPDVLTAAAVTEAPVNQAEAVSSESKTESGFSALLPNAPASAESRVDLSALQSQNKDFAAWLHIPGTVIDYPVVRSDNSDYYLHHLFMGEKSKLGCLFSLMSSDYEAPSRNIAIYGHHLSTTDAMFSTLMEYKDAGYYQEHSTIRLDSLYGSRAYRIFAVLNQKVTDWDASTADFSNEEAFCQYIQRAKRLAFYDTGVEVSDEDHILTLITCDRSYGGLRGRLIVMAVEEQNKEENTCD